MITLKQISYALAVAKTLHFKKAAEACAVSQSALSTALTELEKQLDVQIFERDNKKVLITPQGRQFLDRAQLIKQQMDELYRLSQSQGAPLNCPMSLGIIPTIAPFLLPRVLPAVQAQYPDFHLTIVEETSQSLLAKLRQGDIDAAILALPYNHDGLLAFEFWQEDFYWVAHQQEVGAQAKTISPKALEQAQLMLLQDGHCMKDHALAACKLPTGAPGKAFSATSLLTLVQMAAGGMGSTLVPEMALEQLVAPVADLRALHLKAPGPHRRIAFLVRPNYVGVSDIEILMALFQQQLSKAFGRKA